MAFVFLIIFILLLPPVRTVAWMILKLIFFGFLACIPVGIIAGTIAAVMEDGILGSLPELTFAAVTLTPMALGIWYLRRRYHRNHRLVPPSAANEGRILHDNAGNLYWIPDA